MIDKFSGAHRFLSNFFPVLIIHEGLRYTSVEVAYQASKTLDQEIREGFSQLQSPGTAKRLGQLLHHGGLLRDDWDQVKLDVMHDLLVLKFPSSGGPLTDLLLMTTPEELIEGNRWKDDFWGVYNGKGQNYLGRLLMARRDRLWELTTDRMSRFGPN